MPAIVWLVNILVLAAVLALAAFLMVVLAAFVAVAVVTGLVLHLLGLDRRLMAYLARRAGVRTSFVKVRIDDFERPSDDAWDGAPIEATWRAVESPTDTRGADRAGPD